MLRRAVSLVVMIAISACGGPDGDRAADADGGTATDADGGSTRDAADPIDADASGPSTAPDAADDDDLRALVCMPWAEAACARAEACGCDAVPFDAAACVRSFANRCVQSFVAPGITDRPIQRDLVSSCVDTLIRSSRDCESAIPLSEASCRAMFGVSDPFGDEPSSCVGYRCDLLPVGAPCTAHDECLGGDACIDGHCSHRHGEPCTFSVGSYECGYDAECAGTLVYECAATVPLGGACTPEMPHVSSCGVGARCDDTTRTCVVNPGLGERCDWYRSSCALGLACGEYFTCQELPGRDQACAYGDRGAQWPPRVVCAGGLVCNRGFCGDAPTAGQPCDDNGECAVGFTCEHGPLGDVCREPRDLGQPCGGSGGCLRGLYCDTTAGSCKAQTRAEGQPCGGHGECAEGFACNEVEEGRTACVPDRRIGEMCYWEGRQCEPGAYCRYSLLDGRCESTFCEVLGAPIPGERNEE